MVRSATGIAHARAGLLGNPSDQYGGKTIAFSIRDFAARVSIESSDRLVIRPGPSDLVEFASFLEARDTIRTRGCDDGIRLLRAAIRRFADHCEEIGSRWRRNDFSDSRCATRPASPAGGLAGSSAIVIAALRALMGWFETSIEPAVLAELALAAELEDLGIAAGPMDRVVQCYEGVMLMDLGEPRTAASYTRLAPGNPAAALRRLGSPRRPGLGPRPPGGEKALAGGDEEVAGRWQTSARWWIGVDESRARR